MSDADELRAQLEHAQQMLRAEEKIRRLLEARLDATAQSESHESDLRDQVTTLRAALDAEQREVAHLAASKRALVDELEQLSQSLFEEANEICSAANRVAHDAQTRGEQLADELSMTRM